MEFNVLTWLELNWMEVKYNVLNGNEMKWNDMGVFPLFLDLVGL